jgi:peptide methionine sulfoxide reductase MsrB
MFEDDRSYYQYRAEVEAERAQKATLPSVVKAHSRLADAYRGKLFSDEPVKAETL